MEVWLICLQILSGGILKQKMYKILQKKELGLCESRSV